MSVSLKALRDARRLEEDIAADLQARRIFLSGAGMEKADVRRRASYTSSGRAEGLAFRAEAKSTSRPDYPFRVVDWHDLTRVADADGEIPLFVVRFISKVATMTSVVLREAFAEALELPTTGPIVPVTKTRALRPGERCVLTFAGLHRDERLLVTSYSPFLSALRRHEHDHRERA